MKFNRYTYDLIGFLRWWQEVVKATRVPTPDETDRINESFMVANKLIND